MRNQVSESPAGDRDSHQDQPTPSAGDAAAPAPITAGSEPRPQEPSALRVDTSSMLQRGKHWIERELERPGVGAITVGAALVVAAASVGVSETIVGALGAYAVYRLLRRRRAEHAGQG